MEDTQGNKGTEHGAGSGSGSGYGADAGADSGSGSGVGAVEQVFESKKLFGMIAQYLAVYALKLLRLVSRRFNAIGTPCLFERAYIRYFNYEANDWIKSNARRLYVGKRSSPVLDSRPGRLSSPLTHLAFGGRLNDFLSYIPNSVTEVYFSDRFNQNVDNLPSSLECIVFGRDFNQPVDKLPSSLLRLTLGDKFFQFLDNLPQSLTHLTFSDYSGYSAPLENLPQKLRYLYFGNSFNDSIVLPDSILYLSFGSRFNQPITLPPSLKYLKLDKKFNHPITQFPVSLKTLCLGSNELDCLDKLPPLTTLIFGLEFNQPVDNLPNSITHLTFGFHFNQRVDNLPNSITHLEFNGYFNQPLDHLPNSITHLHVGYYFNQPLDCLPNSITHLSLSNSFSHSIANLPISIISLSACAVIPLEDLHRLTSLTHVALCGQTIPPLGALPQSVTHLSLYVFDNLAVAQLNNVPSSIKVLAVFTQRKFQLCELDALSKRICVVRHAHKHFDRNALLDFGFVVK